MTKYLFIAALVFAGCSKKKQEEAPAPAPVATGSGSAETAPPPTPPPTPAAVDVPTEQDFEEQAKKDIDDKNVAKKLDALEGDLAQ